MKDIIIKHHQELKDNLDKAMDPLKKNKLLKELLDFYSKYRAIIDEDSMPVKIDLSTGLTKRERIFLEYKAGGHSFRSSLSKSQMSYTEYNKSLTKDTFKNKLSEIDALYADLVEDDLLENMRYNQNQAERFELLRSMKATKYSQQERIEDMRLKKALGEGISEESFIDALYGDESDEE